MSLLFLALVLLRGRSRRSVGPAMAAAAALLLDLSASSRVMTVGDQRLLCELPIAQLQARRPRLRFDGGGGGAGAKAIANREISSWAAPAAAAAAVACCCRWRRCF